MTPWRRGLAALTVLGLLGGGGLALALDGEGTKALPLLPEGGSGFRPPPARIGEPLAPSTPAEREQARKADAGLPVPLTRAAARLFLVGFPGGTPDAPSVRKLREREWGAVLIDRANVLDGVTLRSLTAGIADTARAAKRVPPFVVAAQLGGDEVAVPGVGPSGGPGTGSAAEARNDARRAGRSLRRLGIRAVLAPSADLAVSGGPWDRRAFSEDPLTAGRLVDAAVKGWQQARVAPVVGHYPGEGTASQDPELGAATVGLSRAELRERDLRPFDAVLSETPAIQLSGALYADFDGITPATLDPGIIGTLRQSGFRGAIVSANLTAATLATGEGVGAAAVAALKNGCDLLFVPGDQRDQEEAYRAVVRAVRLGTIPVARVREALVRIDRLRRAAG
ncbi:MAG: hypothetical protein JWO90_317 [Solirubrobacterales bacterium]|nr:hypothetical protein [Solirubrobacterales bacterium]